MRQFKKHRSSSIINYTTVICLVLILFSCNQKSVHISDSNAGMNGSFEITSKGLPVNWLFYTSETVPNSDFNIELDQEKFKDGKQSLRFDVKKCSSAGSWQSPGFTNEFLEIGKYKIADNYKLSFYVMNKSSRFKIMAGGVEAKVGGMRTLVDENSEINEWLYYEFDIEIPKDSWMRMELNILEAGTFWIDDIQIKRS